MSSSADVPYFDDKKCDPAAVADVLQFNEELASLVFPLENSGLPVHLDLDESVLVALGDRFGVNSDEVLQHLVDAVKGVSLGSSPGDVFARFAEATKRWQNLRTIKNSEGFGLNTPPALALLAVLVCAAERMRYSDNDEGDQSAVEETRRILAINYYTRLCSLVGSPWSEAEAAEKYRDHAEELWQSLADWLAEWEGERGLCTVSLKATSKVRNWAIQMPISQALLREIDKRSLYRMFESRGLDPGSSITDEMMNFILDEWCTKRYGTHHMQDVWKKVDLRRSLIAAAQKTFESWPGPEQTDSETSAPRIGSKVKMVLTLNAFTKHADFGVEIYIPTGEIPESVSIYTESGQVVDVPVWSGGPRTARIGNTSDFDIESLLSGVLKVSNEQIGLVGTRYPRKIVVFEKSQLDRSYGEVGNVLLGATHGLLVRDNQGPDGGLVQKVKSLLASCAQPGWTSKTAADFGGIPEGWVFLEDVVFVAYPANLDSEMRTLAPIEVESLRLAGGFRVPGRRQRWLANSLPVATAIFPNAQSIAVEIFDSSGVKLYSGSSGMGVFVKPLAEIGLSSGQYEIIAKDDSGGVAKTLIQVIDAGTPNPASLDGSKVNLHRLGGGTAFGFMSANLQTTVHETDLTFRGLDLRKLETVSRGTGDQGEMPPSSAQWSLSSRDVMGAAQAKLRIEKAPEKSCVFQMNHHWILPTYLGGNRPEYVEGVCKYCKFTKQLRGRAKTKRTVARTTVGVMSERPSTAVITQDKIKLIPPVPTVENGVWNDAFEVLCYLRHGSANDLAQVCAQVLSGDTGIDRLVRALVSLGHIDVALDERCRPKSWSISPPVLVQTSSTRGHLAGFRSELLIETLRVNAEQLGGHLERLPLDNAPDAISLVLKDPADFMLVVDGIADWLTQYSLVLQKNASLILLESLPTISEVLVDCPSVRVPVARQINKWDGHEARWKRTENSLTSGAFQNIGNGYTYHFNSSEIEPGEDTRSCTSAVKHIESLRNGVPLVFYDESNQEMICRLGAELPGLLARAAVARSGRTPTEDEKDRLIRYHNIDLETATRIFQILRK